MRYVSRASHELRRSESKKAKLEELSNNISERRCKLKANEPVSERSERAIGYNVGYEIKANEVRFFLISALYYLFKKLEKYDSSRQNLAMES